VEQQQARRRPGDAGLLSGCQGIAQQLEAPKPPDVLALVDPAGREPRIDAGLGDVARAGAVLVEPVQEVLRLGELEHGVLAGGGSQRPGRCGAPEAGSRCQ